MQNAEAAYPMEWESDLSEDNTLVLKAPEATRPVNVNVTTKSGKKFVLALTQVGGLDY